MFEYFVHVKSDGPNTTPYTWQIYRVGTASPLERSDQNFRTAILAKMAGHRRLGELGLVAQKPKAKP
jgi:hypothetical protein